MPSFAATSAVTRIQRISPSNRLIRASKVKLPQVAIASALAQALVAVLSPHLEARLNLVNGREHAQRRGIRVEHVARSEPRNLAESVMVSTEARGQRHEIEGTIFSDGRPRVTSIDEYPMELIPEREMALIFNDDRPGVIGLVGQAFGNAGINIADMATHIWGNGMEYENPLVVTLDNKVVYEATIGGEEDAKLYDQVQNGALDRVNIRLNLRPLFVGHAGVRVDARRIVDLLVGRAGRARRGGARRPNPANAP